MIRVEDITLSYNNGDSPLLENVYAVAPEGDIVALLGRNGCGKSTLLRAIVGYKPINSGRVMIDNRQADTITRKEMASLVSFVTTDQVKIEGLKVFDVVGFGRAPYTNWIGALDEKDHRIINEVLDNVGMLHFASKSIDRLSDGERQRVMIARALAQDTNIVLLDEPTAFLDLPNKFETALLLKKMAHDLGKVVIFSTHDINIALQLCDRLWIVSDHKILDGAPEDLMLSGGLETMFSNTNISFDNSRSEVGLVLKCEGRIAVLIDDERRFAVRNMVERLGFEYCESKDSQYAISCDGNRFIMKTPNRNIAADNLYKMAQEIESMKKG